MLKILRYIAFVTIISLGFYYLYIYDNNLGFSNSLKLLSFLLLIFILFLVNYYIYYKTIMNMDIKQLKYIKGSTFLYYLLLFILFIIFRTKNNIKFDRSGLKKTKGPILVLANHPSKPDFLYAASLVWYKKLKAVADRSLFYNKKTKFMLTSLGGIPKSLFTSDIQTIKLILDSVKRKRSILMMPEGRLSTTNKNDVISYATVKLIKKINIDVVCVKINGAYFTGGKWIKNKRRGRILVTSDVVIKKEDINNYSEDELYQILSDALSVDDNEFIKENNIYFNSDDLTHNLNTVLYVCPNCNNEYSLVTTNNKIKCSCCNLELDFSNQCEILLDNKPYIYNTISKWHDFQKQKELEFVKNDDFIIEDYFDLYVQTNKDKTPILLNSGIACYTKSGFTYISGDYKLEFKSVNMPALAFVCNTQFEIYYKEYHYAFVPKNNILSLIKWATIVEMNYINITKEES